MYSMEFMRSDVFYLFIDVLVLSLVLVFVAVRKENYVALSVFIFVALVFKLVVFVGFRPFDAGNDTIGYYHTFQSIGSVFNAREVGGMYGGTDKAGELLYWPFVALVKPLLGDSFRLFLIFSILICGYFTYLGNKSLVDAEEVLGQRKKIAISLVLTYLVFLSFELIYFGGHIRSAFGIPLALLACCYASKRRVLMAAVLLFLAVGFHSSAISVLPLMLGGVFVANVRQSKMMTLLVVVLLTILFVFGKFGGIGSIMGLIGGYYLDRYVAYVEYEGFNIASVFSTAYFWIILAHLVVFLLVGYRKVHFYAFYYMGLVLVFSSTPKISERFFAYILICLPFLLYISLRTRYGERSSILFTVLFSCVISPLVITSYAATSTLTMHSYIYPR